MGRQLFFSKEMKFEIIIFLASLLASMLADDYIYGGPEVSTYEYPFIARLAIHGYGDCTGSLITEDLILTAKHCFVREDNVVFPDGTATFNDADRDIKEPGEVIYNMRFIENNYANDLALAKLERKVGIKPVKISRKRVNVGDAVKAVGFGWHGWHGPSNAGRKTYDGHLRHIDLRVSRVEENWIYTAIGRNNEGPCAGDSGGALLVRDGWEWSVVATLKGGGFDCRTGLVNGDDKWSSVLVKGF